MKAALVFLQYGPYHYARAAGLKRGLGSRGELVLVQVAAESETYAWETPAEAALGLVTLCQGTEEKATFGRVFWAACRFWRMQNIDVALLPSYSPAAPLALLLSARLCGVRCVMMNESHAGTEKAQGAKRLLKQFLVSLFDAALVGGSPQKRHFVNLGMSPERIFLGYDAVDNDKFAHAAVKARTSEIEMRKQFALPSRYFLSLGRFVEKKDLPTLFRAYARFAQNCPEPVALVIVGSGPQEQELRVLASMLGLGIVESAGDPADARTEAYRMVYFMGFRQVQENPVYYALAEAFILPSAWEEWGLVVNEAMACGLPVLVSKNVGCAEDLVVDGANGWVFNPGDVAALADRMSELVHDTELRQRMGLASSERIAAWGCDRFASGAIQAVAFALEGPQVVS